MTSFYEIDCPDLDPKPIDQAHLDEWVQGSGISEEIAQLNLQTLDGQAAINVITEEKISNLPGHAQQYATSPIARILKKFDHLSEGGWWCPGTPGNWGCFKPDNPRTDEKGKTIKYEQPLGQKTGVFYLNHPRRNYWEEIFDYPATHTIVITEGVKKAAALITAGVPAIALPGIWNGTPRVDPLIEGSPCHLHPELKKITRHKIVIAFDYSESSKGRRSVSAAAKRLAHCLYREGCPSVGLATCTGPDKGIDDVMVREGAMAVHSQILNAIHIDIPAENKRLQKINDIKRAAVAYLESDEEAERAHIKAITCRQESLSGVDFNAVVRQEMERRNPLQRLECKSLSLQEVEEQEVEHARTFFDQLLIERWSTLIGGRKGSTKSIFALHALIRLCSEKPRDLINVRCEASNLRALYVCADMPLERINGYLHQMGYSNDSSIKKNLRVWGNSLNTRSWDIRNIDGLKQELDNHQPSIVVIDSLKAALGPLLEDISKPIMRHYMDSVHNVILQSAACLWVHHANKKNEIADNEALQEAPDIIYQLSKSATDVCTLKPIKCRAGVGIRREYFLQEDFLDIVALEPGINTDMGKVRSDVIQYVQAQNRGDIFPSIQTVIEGLTPMGHDREAIKSCIRRASRLGGCLSRRRNPKDHREALLEFTPSLPFERKT